MDQKSAERAAAQQALNGYAHIIAATPELQPGSGTKKVPKGMDTQRNLAKKGPKTMEKQRKNMKFPWVSCPLGTFLAPYRQPEICVCTHYLKKWGGLLLIPVSFFARVLAVEQPTRHA